MTAAPSGLVRQVVAQASPGKSPPPRRSCSAGGERMSPRPRPPCRSVPTRPQSCKSRFYDIGTARSPATTSPNGTHRRAAVDPPAQTALRASPRHPCVHCIDICARSIGSMLHASVTDARGSPRTDTITSSRARVDQVVDEEHPPSSTGRPDTMLTGGRGGAEAQMPSEARDPLCPPLLPHALRGACFSSL